MACREYLNSSYSLDGGWDFAYTQQLPVENGDIKLPSADHFKTTMPVPAYWDDHLERLKHADLWYDTRFNADYKPVDFSILPKAPEEQGDMSSVGLIPYLVGVGWYRKQISIPASWSGSTLLLTIGGAVLETWVWINGTMAITHFGHSTPFTANIEEYLKPGCSNEIVIAVSNQSRAIWGSDLIGYKSFGGGIYRGVTLKVAGSCHISDLYIHASEDLGHLRWRVELSGKIEGNEHLDWIILDPQSEDILGSGTQSASSPILEWESGTFGMEPWSDTNPCLYEIQLSLRTGDVMQDTTIRPFGLRRLLSRGRELLLNGQPVMLRGHTECCYFAKTCTPPLEVESYREIIRSLKGIGFNWLRFHTWVPSDEYLQAADELGMMIQVEAPVGFDEKQWLAILRHVRQHPSVVLYCCGNEDLLNEEKLAELESMGKLMRLHVPDGLYSPMEALRGIEYGFYGNDSGPAEQIEEKPFKHNRVRLERVKAMADVIANYANGKVSYHSRTGSWRELDEAMAIYARPCLTHEAGIIGSYLNLDLERRYENTRTGTALYASARSNLAAAGLLDKSPLYFHNACAWSRILRKHAFETVRKCSMMNGYDYLGAIDYPYMRGGYECGILNEFYELKPGDSSADILAYNGESVLLLDHTNQRNLYGGDEFSCSAMVSLYGRSGIENGQLTWALIHAGSGEALCRDTLDVGAIMTGKVSSLGKIDFAVPCLRHPARAVLQMRLSGGAYELANAWDFWLFPRREAPTIKGTADAAALSLLSGRYPGIMPQGRAGNHENAQNQHINVVSKLDEKHLQQLSEGGKVLLLGVAPFHAIPMDFQIAMPGRTFGNSATVIADHRVMHDFPHDGFCDWQFYSLFEGASAVCFDNDNLPLNPIIEVVSTYKRVYRQASVFELQVGKGSLLVCSLRIDMADPATACLVDNLLAYLSGDKCQPKASIMPDTLHALISRKCTSTAILSSDEGYDKALRKVQLRAKKD